jgi:hypothetical protein
MEWDLNNIVNVSIASLFGTLLLLFIYQTTRKQRSAPHFLILLTFGMVGGIFAFLDSARIFPDPKRIFLAAQLTCYGFQFFFFYLFLEELRGLKVNTARFMIAFGLLALQVFSLWTIVWFKEYPVTGDLWLLADTGYDGLALFTFLGCGIPVYLKTYRITKEMKALFLSFALLIVSLGFIIIFGVDYTNYFGQTPAWLDDISDFGEIFPMTGLLLFVLSYLSNVDYIYRLPNDNYILMVTYKSGVTIHAVKFQNRANIVVEENLISGLLTTINIIFTNVLKSTNYIESMTSKNATILMQAGEKIVATIMADSASAILVRALKRYVTEFERTFKASLDADESNMEVYDPAKNLLQTIFPFIHIKETKPSA